MGMVLTFLFLAGSFSYISYINIEVRIAGNERREGGFEEMEEERKNRKVFWRADGRRKIGKKRF
jgi:hypothetical protein